MLLEGFTRIGMLTLAFSQINIPRYISLRIGHAPTVSQVCYPGHNFKVHHALSLCIRHDQKTVVDTSSCLYT